MRPILATGIGVAAAVSGCLLPDLGRFTGGGSSSADATVEADSSARDASRDVIVVGDGGCPDGAFCDDFDHGVLGADWTAKAEQDGVLSLEDGGLSAPNRLVVAMQPLKVVRFASLTKSVSVSRNPSRIVCAVSVRIEGRPLAQFGDFQLLGVVERGGGRVDDVFAQVVTQGSTYLSETTTSADGGSSTNDVVLKVGGGAIADGVWTRLTLDVDYANARATLTTAPASGNGGTITSPIAPVATATSFDVVLGDPVDHDDGPSKASFDDLRCDFSL